MSKRIIHISCVAPPEIGGIGSVAAKEVEGLQALGFDAHHLSLSSHPSVRVGNTGRILALQHAVNGADIVHLHYPFYGTAGLLARWKTQGKIAKLVITFHMDASAPGLKGLAADFHRRFFQQDILNAADQILVSSLDYARESSLGLSMEKVQELPFGIDEHEFCPSKVTESVALNKILFVGGMDRAHAFKGIDLLLRALCGLPNAVCALVGEGGLRVKYESLAAELGIAERIRFTGKLEKDALIQLYQTSTVLAFPSTSMAEAFGLVALEAQACGTPVVASDLPGVRTVVIHGETGLLIPVGNVEALRDGLSRFLHDRALRDRMGGAAREHVLNRFTWTKHMEGLTDVYHRICAS